MKRHSAFLPTGLWGSLLAGLTVFAASSAHAESLKALSDKLAPHRAIYELQTAKIAEGSGVAEVGGAISYEFRATCEAWTVKHKFKLAITRADKPEVVSTTDFESTESKDGTRFGFQSTTRANGQVSQQVKGEATLERPGGPGKVELTEPTKEQSRLPAGTVFPTYHSLMLVAAAQGGKQSLWVPLYDASDKAQYSGVNALILGRETGTFDLPLPEGGKPLIDDPGWTFRIAYFDVESGDQKPTYEMTIRLNENGVTPTMTLDYGEFVLRGVLRTIEPLPGPDC